MCIKAAISILLFLLPAILQAEELVWDTFDGPPTFESYIVDGSSKFEVVTPYPGLGSARRIKFDALGPEVLSIIEISEGCLTGSTGGGLEAFIVSYGESSNQLNFDLSSYEDDAWFIEYTLSRDTQMEFVVALSSIFPGPVASAAMALDIVGTGEMREAVFPLSQFSRIDEFDLTDVDIVSIGANSARAFGEPFSLQLHDVRLVPEPSTAFQLIVSILLIARRRRIYSQLQLQHGTTP